MRRSSPRLSRTDVEPTDAELNAEVILGVHYTCLKDELSCPACRTADDDKLRRLDDPVRLDNMPPNPNCTSTEECRCTEVYVLEDESPPPEGWNWSNESLELNRRDADEASPG